MVDNGNKLNGQGVVDWSKPIEAVGPFGRIVSVELSKNHAQPDCDGDYTLIPGSLDGQDVYHSTGESWNNGCWRIRNTTPATRTAHDQLERMEALEALLKRVAADDIPVGEYMDIKKTARALLPEPVDPDLVEARECAAIACEMGYSIVSNGKTLFGEDAAKAIRDGKADDERGVVDRYRCIKRGRELAGEGK